jgi:ligand-binding sensor domain-containing protein
MKSAITVLVICCFYSMLPEYCLGQIRDSTNEKLHKTQGSNEYANVHRSIQDKTGNLWFCTSGEGVYRYDGKTFKQFTVADGLSNNAVWAVLEDTEGNIWFGTDSGLCLYTPHTSAAGKWFRPVSLTADTASLLPQISYPMYSPFNTSAVNCIFQDRGGKLWIATNEAVFCSYGRGFKRFLENDGVLNKNGVRLNMVQNMLEDKLGNIWFTTWFDGICCFDGKSIINFKPNGERWYAGLMEDKTGKIWVGRRDKGLCRYDPQMETGGPRFTNVVQKGILDSCCIADIIQDKAGTIWIATEFGDMNRRDLKGGLWRFDGNTFTNFTPKDGLSNYSVFSLVEDRTGKIWAGTRNTGLCCYDGKAFIHFSE